MTFDFHPEAREEFHDASHWYEDRSIFAGDRFVNAVRAAVTSILADPLRYQVVDEGIRVCRLKKFPFRLYYSFDARDHFICIYAVMDEKRRPNYWRNRVLE
jgi:toxin ParE1/3/4